MTALEEIVAIDAAQEGMVLFQDLRDAGGAVLLPAGASLSVASLSSLRRRGIEQISIVATAAPEDPAIAEAERARRLQRLAHLFRHSAAQGASATLLARLQAYRAGGTP